MTVWPYPRWIAHRGAGKLAPENTLAAFRLGAEHGYRMVECDVKLSADGVPFLLHDATLERTTNGQGTAGDLPWAELSRLDAGGWHSRRFAGETLPSFEAISRWCQANGVLLNIEIKPTPGHALRTGEKVALLAAELWAGQATPPLLTSFEPAALEGARNGGPDLPRGLLLHQWDDAVWAITSTLGCQALICQHGLWTAERVHKARSHGLRTLSYTVNEATVARELLALGTDGIITDRIDLFNPDDA